VLESRRRRRREHWRDKPLPGLPVATSRRTSTPSRSRPTRRGRGRSQRQPEIQAYLRRCAKDAGVMQHVQFGHAVTGAAWDEDAQLWRIDTAGGPFTARLLVAAPGPLSGTPRFPSPPGNRGLSGQGIPLGRVGPRPRSRRRARGGHRHRRSAIQFVPQIQPSGRTAAPLPAHAGVGSCPTRTVRSAGSNDGSTARSRPPSASCARGIYWARETFVFGFLTAA